MITLNQAKKNFLGDNDYATPFMEHQVCCEIRLADIKIYLNKQEQKK